MDYEKAYKAVLKTATQWIKDGCTDKEKICLECVFPELKESEDERIIKELITYHKGMAKVNEETCNPNNLHTKWVAYLERQKINTEGDFARGYDCGYECCLNSHGAEWLEKQKEQEPVEKPINWTELTWKDINELEGIINKVHYEFRNGIGEESFGKEVLERFREYKGDEYLDEIEQKPAGWSEKDKDLLLDTKCIIDEVWHSENTFGYSKEELKETWNWLDTLWQRVEYPQTKQEWSEEDEKIRRDTIRILETASPIPLRNGKVQLRFSKNILWLKSLRPQPRWKPTEEQMEVLKRAADNADDAEDASVLLNLCKALKKL